MTDRGVEIIDLDPFITEQPLVLTPGATLHIGKNPTASPKRIAKRCTHADYVTLVGLDDGVRVLCVRESGAWLFVVRDDVAVDERVHLDGVTWERLDRSIAAHTGHARQTLTRWIRTGSATLEVHDHVGAFAQLLAGASPHEVRRHGKIT